MAANATRSVVAIGLAVGLIYVGTRGSGRMLDALDALRGKSTNPAADRTADNAQVSTNGLAPDPTKNAAGDGGASRLLQLQKRRAAAGDGGPARSYDVTYSHQSALTGQWVTSSEGNF